MSLRDFVELSDVAALLKPFRPSPKRVNWSLKVAPTDGIDVKLTGTAFDYLLRFELKRRAPHASDGRWVAESAPNYLCFEAATPGKQTGPRLINAKDTDPVPDMFDMSERVTTVCGAASKAHADYIKNPAPDAETQQAIAASGIIGRRHGCAGDGAHPAAVLGSHDARRATERRGDVPRTRHQPPAGGTGSRPALHRRRMPREGDLRPQHRPLATHSTTRCRRGRVRC